MDIMIQIAHIRVRDSSGKPATCVASEDLQRIARPERSEGHAQEIKQT